MSKKYLAKQYPLFRNIILLGFNVLFLRETLALSFDLIPNQLDNKTVISQAVNRNLINQDDPEKLTFFAMTCHGDFAVVRRKNEASYRVLSGAGKNDEMGGSVVISTTSSQPAAQPFGARIYRDPSNNAIIVDLTTKKENYLKVTVLNYLLYGKSEFNQRISVLKSFFESISKKEQYFANFVQQDSQKILGFFGELKKVENVKDRIAVLIAVREAPFLGEFFILPSNQNIIVGVGPNAQNQEVATFLRLDEPVSELIKFIPTITAKS